MEGIRGEGLKGVVRVTILTGGAEILRRGERVYNCRRRGEMVEWERRSGVEGKD